VHKSLNTATQVQTVSGNELYIFTQAKTEHITRQLETVWHQLLLSGNTIYAWPTCSERQ